MDAGDADAYLAAPRDYYSDETGMVALAFNSSTPIVYLQRRASSKPPVSTHRRRTGRFDDFMATCEASKRRESRTAQRSDRSAGIFEQILANSGGLYFDNDNGRTGRADEVAVQPGPGRRSVRLPDRADRRRACSQPG